MSTKIVIDAGHGGFDNGGVYLNRIEKDDNLRLAKAVGELLENQGIDVLYTRENDEFVTLEDRIDKANKENADYYISFHRAQSPYPNTYNGTQIMIFNRGDIKEEICRNIIKELKKTGFEDLGCKVTRNYEVLKGTRMPALLLQIGFINSDTDNKIFESNFDGIAKAITTGILESLSEKVMDTVPKYVIQLGLFREYNHAINLYGDLSEKGIETFIAMKGPYYGVFLGEFASLVDAAEAEDKLNQLGYPTLILEV